MNEEEFKRNIRWKKEEDSMGTSLTGGFIFSICLKTHSIDTDFLPYAKKEIEERLLRYFYEDRRKEFYEKIEELLRIDAWNANELLKWRDELLRIAKRQ